MKLFIILGVTLTLNLGCGYFRAQTRKYSWLWFLYIHLPIPIVIFMRVVSGFGYSYIPALVATSVLGQWGGGKLPRVKTKNPLNFI